MNMSIIEIFKRAIKIFIMLPNLPFIIVLAIYIVVNIIANTNPVEMEIISNSDDGFMNNEIKEHIKKIYPKKFTRAIAFIFYIWIGAKLIFINN